VRNDDMAIIETARGPAAKYFRRPKGREFDQPSRATTIAVWTVLVVLGLQLVGAIASVLVNSLSRQWFDSWFPTKWTVDWYSAAWEEFALRRVLGVTFIVGVAVVALSLLIAVPAAYALVRSHFPGKGLVLLALGLPVVLPTITYGVPLATLLYSLGLGGTLTGVIIINLVPAVPFAVLVLVPFLGAVEHSIEHAARMCGASTAKVFLHILVPLMRNGILATAILLLVRTLGNFDLTFLISDPDSQTLVVALYYAVSAAGFRVNSSIDAMAMIYMLTNVVLLAFAFRYVNPSRMLARSS
jgi:putative spermidine/putrescine transport system permease protein